MRVPFIVHFVMVHSTSAELEVEVAENVLQLAKLSTISEQSAILRN